MMFYRLTDDEEDDADLGRRMMDEDEDEDDACPQSPFKKARMEEGERIRRSNVERNFQQMMDEDEDEDEDDACPQSPFKKTRIEEIDSEEGERIRRSNVEREFQQMMDDDEFNPPDNYSYYEYERCNAELTRRVKQWTEWVNSQVTTLMKNPKGYGLPMYRFESLWEKWVEFLIAYEHQLSTSRLLVTHTDRSVKVMQGAYIFATMLQMYFVKTFPKMYAARSEISERFDMLQDDDLLDDVEGVEENRLPGGWDAPENNRQQWSRATELEGESRNIRLFRMKVYHLGIHFDGWITRLTKSEYDEERRLERMSHAEYCAHINAEDPSKVNPFLPSDRMYLPHWKRVVDYTQDEVVRAIKLFTRDMDRMEPTEAVRDFFDALLYRVAIFFTETAPGEVLDREDFRTLVQLDEQGRSAYMFNRNFLVFTYCYFFPPIRQFYFWDLYSDEGNQFEPIFRADPNNDLKDIKWLLKKGESRLDANFQERRARLDDITGCTRAQTEAVRKWVTGAVLPGLGDVGFNTLYEQCAEDAYRIECDARFFKYLKPESPDNTSAVIRDMRPEDTALLSELFQEYEVSLLNITNGVGRNYMSDLFMTWAIGRYWESLVHRDMDWKETFCISADQLSMSTLTIQESSRPLLVQIFGCWHFVVEGRAYRPANLMEGVTLWFLCIDRWFHGTLDWEVKSGGRFKERMEIRNLLDDIFRPKLKYADRGTLLHQRPLE